MRALFLSHQFLFDPSTGSCWNCRTVARWLVEAGHDCRAVTTTATGSAVFNPAADMQQRGATVSRVGLPGQEAVSIASTATDGIRANVVDAGDGGLLERGFAHACRETMKQFAPQLVVGCDPHPAVTEVIQTASQAGIATAVLGNGWREPMGDIAFRWEPGLVLDPNASVTADSLPIPLDQETIRAPVHSPVFATFVDPSPDSGTGLFVRLASMLGEQRPDIPVLLVQGRHAASTLNACPGVDFSAFGQVQAAPCVGSPAEFLALTRLLLLPTSGEYARLIPEAQLNGIPVLTAEGDPNAALLVYADGLTGGGQVPTPALPAFPEPASEADTQPWFDAVCSIWDTPDDGWSAAIRSAARQRWDELTLRGQIIGRLEAAVVGVTETGIDGAAPGAGS